MLTFKKYLSIVNEAISNIKYPQNPAGLYEPIAYTMALGGKRLRPILALMAYEAFSGKALKEDIISPAVGIEMFHNFTLLHDDVMDKAPIRRGKPTVHVKWDESTAIISGDAMLTMATQLAAKAPALYIEKALELFNTTAMEIYEGQQYDMDFESRSDVTADEYISMIRLKTSVLLGCGCKMGALIAGASENNCKLIYDFGVNLGLAFQLQDDLLDVYGDSNTFGKAIGGDILNNKKTYLLINALNKAEGKDVAELALWINAQSPNKEVKIEAVTAIYNRLGIKGLTEKAISNYLDKAIDTLNSIELSKDAHNAFHEFVDMLMNRTK